MRSLARRISSRVLHQWPLKGAAVVISTALWVYVLNQQNPIVTKEFVVEVMVTGIPKDLELLSIDPKQVTVTLRGRASMLSGSQAPLALQVDVSAGSVGSQEMPLRVVARPAGVDVVHLETKHVKVHLDLSVSTKRPVIVETPGLPAEGYRAYPGSAQPSTVSVAGPASMVQRVTKLVATLDISGLSATASQLVKVEPRDEVGLPVPAVRVEPDKVRVVVPIRPVNVKLVAIWPDLGDPPPGYQVRRLSVRPAGVVVSAAPTVLRTLQTVRTESIDISDLRRTRTYSVRLRVPEGVSILGPASAQVTVEVTRIRAGRSEATAPAETEETQAVPRPAPEPSASEGSQEETPALGSHGELPSGGTSHTPATPPSR